MDVRENYAVALRDVADEALADLGHGLAVFTRMSGEVRRGGADVPAAEVGRMARHAAPMRWVADARGHAGGR